VFIAGAENGLIPHEKSMESEEAEAGNLEEERRLFYVAITRAREKLYITSCIQRRQQQNVIDCEPSPFLEEIPKELIKIYEKENEVVDDAQAQKFIAQMKALFD
jgi:DNA helicase-2/ATP-dependent DNA helicase PcrA